VNDPLKSVPPVAESGLARHAHHWFIAVQDGPSSEGVCKECGERRDFSNSFTQRQPIWLRRSASPRPDTPTGT
jgi:hypothetical protein